MFVIAAEVLNRVTKEKPVNREILTVQRGWRGMFICMFTCMCVCLHVSVSRLHSSYRGFQRLEVFLGQCNSWKEQKVSCFHHFHAAKKYSKGNTGRNHSKGKYRRRHLSPDHIQFDTSLLLMIVLALKAMFFPRFYNIIHWCPKGWFYWTLKNAWSVVTHFFSVLHHFLKILKSRSASFSVFVCLGFFVCLFLKKNSPSVTSLLSILRDKHGPDSFPLKCRYVRDGTRQKGERIYIFQRIMKQKPKRNKLEMMTELFVLESLN